MAYRTWGKVLLAALGVGLLAGAGQLGFAYGLGVVRFARDFEELSGQWAAQLAWVAWFAMLAAVAGGLAGNWLARRGGLGSTIGTRVAISVAAGVGALAVAPLAMLPARSAETGDGSPVTVAGLSAALGALVGVFAALAVLSQRVAGLNLGAVTVVVWLIALVSVAPSLGPDDPLPEVRLGVLDATWLGDGLAQRLAVIVMPAIALAVGAGIGALARWRGLPMTPVALSGVVGPLLLAVAYLIAGPGSDSDRYQAAPYWGAVISVAAGGLGSVLASVARQLTADGGLLAGGGSGARHGDHTAEVFPGYAGPAGEGRHSGPDGDTLAGPSGAESGGAGETATSGREGGFNAWGDDKTTTGTDTYGSPSSGYASSDRDPLGGQSTDTSFGGDPRRDGPASSFGTDTAGDSTTRSFGTDRPSFGSDAAGSGSASSLGRSDRISFGGEPAGDSPTSSFGTDRPSFGGGSDSSASSPGRSDRVSFGGDDPVGSRGDDSSTSSFGRSDRDSLGGDPGRGSSPTSSFGHTDRDAFGDDSDRSQTNSFGRSGRDAFGGRDSDGANSAGAGGVPAPRGEEFSGGRARDLGDVEWSARPGSSSSGPRAGGQPAFDAPTPVAPARQPEVVSPPPGPEPTPIRPFDRQPAAGTGDWRSDKTSTFPSAPTPIVPAPIVPVVPVVPAPPPTEAGRRDDSDFRTRPTSTQPQPAAPGGIPRQPGQSGAGPTGGEMPDWRLAPPAWTPPPPVSPSEPAPGPIDLPDVPAAPAQADQAPEQKRRGLFRRKNKSEPARPEPVAATPTTRTPATETPATETPDNWVELPTRSGSAADPFDRQPQAGEPAPAGPRGFGFGGLVSSRFGSGRERASEEAASANANRESAASEGASDLGSGDLGARAFGMRDLGASDPGRGNWRGADRAGTDTDHTVERAGVDRAGVDAGHTADDQDAGRSGWRTSPADAGAASSWNARRADPGTTGGSHGADPAADPTAISGSAPDPDRGGRKPTRSERHLRSVDLGDNKTDRPTRSSDSDAGSWDIDDPITPARGAKARDDDAGSDADAPATGADQEAPAASGRGLFRRNRNNSDTAETPAEQDSPEPSRGRGRGKTDKPIQKRDEEYVDWVAGLSAPEPVNERRRDDVPRRSLRSTTRQKDD